MKYLGLLLVIVAFSLLLYIFRDALQHFEKMGYAGLFFVSLLMNSTLVMPLPTGLLTSTMGALYNPFLIGLVAGTGAALGEVSGYLAGISGREVLYSKANGDRIERYLMRYGNFGILFLAFIPNPAFDLVGIASGVLKFSFYRFLFWCWIGKVLKMLMFAYFGDVLLK